jgi:hypothetical protein
MTEEPKPLRATDADQPPTQRGSPRRRLILGGGATASTILVLFNRPALAASCTHSVWRSHMANGANFNSHGTVPTSCGDKPSTWHAAAVADWTPNWGGQPGGFGPNTVFSTFFFSDTSKWSVSPSSADMMDKALQGLVTSVKRISPHGGTLSQSTLFAQHAVAALLNANFYETSYGSSSNAQSFSAVQTLIKPNFGPDASAADDWVKKTFLPIYQPLNVN